jgi:hypothetical protein
MQTNTALALGFLLSTLYPIQCMIEYLRTVENLVCVLAASCSEVKFITHGADIYQMFAKYPVWFRFWSIY